MKAKTHMRNKEKVKLVYEKNAIELKKEGWLKVSSVNFLVRFSFI